MACIALDVQKDAPQDPLAPRPATVLFLSLSSRYVRTRISTINEKLIIETLQLKQVKLTETFLEIAES